MSLEAPTIYPTMRYHDAPAGMAFIEQAFGFRRTQMIENPDGTIAHAELAYGPSILMLGSEREDTLAGPRAGQGWLYVAVDDADDTCDRARQAGAEIVIELHDTDYGSRDFAARDFEGNLWNFGTYRPAPIESDQASGSGG